MILMENELTGSSSDVTSTLSLCLDRLIFNGWTRHPWLNLTILI